METSMQSKKRYYLTKFNEHVTWHWCLSFFMLRCSLKDAYIIISLHFHTSFILCNLINWITLIYMSEPCTKPKVPFKHMHLPSFVYKRHIYYYYMNKLFYWIFNKNLPKMIGVKKDHIIKLNKLISIHYCD